MTADPLTFAGLRTLAANKAARWGAGLLLFGAVGLLGRCQGASSARATDRIWLDDSVAKARANDAKDDDARRAADSAANASLTIALEKARDTTQRAIDSASAMLGRLSVVKASAVGTITVLKSPAGETPVGAESMAAPETDSVRFAEIQRQGDARVYTVPQFVVDLGAELRKALAAAQSTIARDSVTIAARDRTIADDARAILDRDAQLTARADAETVAKSSAGRDCRLLPFVPCPSRKVVAIGAFAIGVAGGAFAAHQLEAKK